jgi:hypothetical protein
MSHIFCQKFQCEASGWRVPLTTKYGNERKSSGQRWEKMERNEFMTKILLIFSSMKHLNSIQFSVSKTRIKYQTEWTAFCRL